MCICIKTIVSLTRIPVYQNLPVSCTIFLNYFLAVNKAYKTLENEEGYKRCKEIVEEAKTRTEDMVSILMMLISLDMFVLLQLKTKSILK